ncbi:MAG TPA: carboxypeptidase-like regulatory domain-containing protein [Segetibacter sp.]|nr:carboxypeptidase-like regulatory domain-containing protein [Segetibacter sp.]
MFGASMFLFLNVIAQDTTRISGDFKSTGFQEFVTAIENQSKYRFYFDNSETDSIAIIGVFNNELLSKVLEEVLKNTALKFSIDRDRVFITRNYSIQTELPTDFFTKKATNNDSAIATSKVAVLRVSDQKATNFIENKLIEIGSNQNHVTGKATIAGYIRDAKNGEAIAGASVYILKPSIVANTDQFGYFSLTIPKGRYEILVSSVGMKDTKRQVMLYSDGKLDVDMQNFIATLKGVVVTSDRRSNVKGLQMGLEKLNIRQIKQIPVVFGETDILKVVLTLPGVTSVGEASNGFNVRGGSTDQNLILFNDATIYNPSHLFGFFSAFNSEMIKGIELYKSAIPVKYGGRLSSVLDVAVRDGNIKKWTGSGGIGPLTSKFSIEGPIKKDKTSLIFGSRTTYSNWLLRSIPKTAYSNSKANFYDLNLHISHILNPKNTVYLTGYFSNDQFNLNSDTTYRYSNRNFSLKWKHIFNNKFNNVVTAVSDHYDYAVSSIQNPVNAYKLGFDINQFNLRSDFSYIPGHKHNISFGFNSIFYKLHPGFYEPLGERSLVTKNVVAAEQGLESALYLGDEYAFSTKFSINAGLRYSMFNFLGAHDIYKYAPGVPRNKNTIIDTTAYDGGKFIKTYHAPEVRVSFRYALSANASLKLSFNTLQQYIHMLSNTTAISPTDIWKLSDPNIKPQQGRQFSLGYYQTFKSNTIETSIEAYYKQTNHFLDYKSGASLILNKHIETEVMNTRGKAYGVELLIKKLSGKFNGWISYTYSRTLLKIDDAIASELVNKGNYYPANFDKPHNLNFISNYRFSHRLSISANFVYSTGRPITLPLAVFNIGGAPSLYYSERNEYRIPDYLRADLSVTLEGNHKVKQKIHNSWSAGVYNLTGRQNAYSVYFTQENAKIRGYQFSVFGTIIPFITYNFKF